VGDNELDFAIIDGLGHGISSTLLTGLAVGAYRHARRTGASIPDIHAVIDQALADHYDDDSFATGIIGRLTLATGRLEWTCAGHLPPLLLRGGKVVAELGNDPIVPFGLRGEPPQVCAADLEPGDTVLLYTDGVTEAHLPNGEQFGLPRLIDLVEREAAASQEPEEILRRLVAELLAHQPGGLRDDATFLLVRWTGRALRRRPIAGTCPGAITGQCLRQHLKSPGPSAVMAVTRQCRRRGRGRRPRAGRGRESRL
jgi:serine phosphatase RsbU (regulator of sigma subunit)